MELRLISSTHPFPKLQGPLDVRVASALPWIAAYFGTELLRPLKQARSLSLTGSIISAFSLNSTAFIPFRGQMGDMFGRHWSLQICSLIMLIGSALCIGAPTDAFGAFLLGRAIQGVICAGLNTLVRVILADNVTSKENAKNWSLFVFTGGMCYGIGPAIGGYLAIYLLGPQPIPGLDEDHLGRREKFAKRMTSVDIVEQLLFLFGFGLMVLAFIWAGATYDWNHPAVLVPLIVGSLLACAWLYYEYSIGSGGVFSRKLSFQRPMMPWKVIRERNVNFLYYINFVAGMAMYSVLYFVDIYFTTVEAGVQLLYYPSGLGVGVYLSMFFCNVWPRQTFLPLVLGSMIEAVGIGMLPWALYFEYIPAIYSMMVLTSTGTGLRFTPVISVMAVATTFGGTMALTIMSNVFNNMTGISRDSPFQNDYSAINNLPDEISPGYWWRKMHCCGGLPRKCDYT
ncbi:major facilitator superfamily domain-containing protein [Hypoxylon cercidicola]|nr:major facilitator superfamily domain-containing protein [Hypoxylon cercidicola]